MADLQNWIRHGDEMRRPFLVNSDLPKAEKLVIVGGGLSGLCCALRIAEKRPELPILLVEKSAELGGVIATWQEDDWICDLAVNATRPHPAFWRLIDDLQLSDKFQTSNPKAKSRWILLDDKQHKLSPFSLLKIGPFKLRKALRLVKNGGYSVADLIPNKQIADALTLGIVNDTASNVDADFLMPSVTKFGDNPPVKKSKLASLIAKSYPLFTPKKGTIASLDGGMITLTKALIERLNTMSNVEIRLNYNAQSPKLVAAENNVPLSSIIWSAPGLEDGYESTELSIFAIGYEHQQVAKVKLGYGTLIPNQSLPISGILHESDIHQSKRSPSGHRLFRLMVPHSRWDKDEASVLACAEKLLAKKPVLFTKIGEREIPRYKPGYMAEIATLSPEFSMVGWAVSGVSITHVVDEAERVAELF